MAGGPTASSTSRTRAPTVVDTDVYRPVTPTRLLDTRTGLGAPAAKVAAGTSIGLQVSGRAGIPSGGVGTAVLNVTVTAPATAGYLTNYPSGATRPGSRSVSYTTAGTVSELVPARLGTDGRVRLYTSATTHLVADVVGWYPTTGHLVSVTPHPRPRHPHGPRRRAGAHPGGRQRRPAGRRGRHRAEHGGVSGRPRLSAVAPGAGGWLTAYPTGTTRPTTAHVRYDADGAMTGAVVSRIGTGGKVTIQSTAGTDLLVDVVGLVQDRR